jgi:hypothetical protein
MRIFKIINLFVFLIVLFWILPSEAIDKRALFNDQINHKALSFSTWGDLTEKNLKERVLNAPDIIIDYLIRENQIQGYREIPRRAKIDDFFYSDIIYAITELPQSVKTHINDHLAAVFLVEDLGSTGFCELLRNFDKNKLGFIVIDVGALDRKANEWASWRETSPFTKKGSYTIEAEIEHPDDNNRQAAIQYILLHEIGHLIGVAKGAHPHWMNGGNPQEWPFTRLSWLTFEGGLKGISRFEKIFQNRVRIRYYSFNDAFLSSNEIDETYAQYLKTDFVSLYAATNMYEDFAETYAMYVHTVLQNRPWKIKIFKKGVIVREITDPILNKRCENKKNYLDNIFKQ